MKTFDSTRREVLFVFGVGVLTLIVFAPWKSWLFGDHAVIVHMTVEDVVVDADILVEAKNPNGTFLDGYLQNQQSILRSRTVVERAMSRRQLKRLAFLKSPDPLAKIGSMVEVEILKEAEGSSGILRISCRGPNAGDCEAVILAVVESYLDFLFETDKRIEEILEAAEKIGLRIKAKLKEVEEKHRQFRVDRGFSAAEHFNFSPRDSEAKITAPHSNRTPAKDRMKQIDDTRISEALAIARANDEGFIPFAGWHNLEVLISEDQIAGEFEAKFLDAGFRAVRVELEEALIEVVDRHCQLKADPALGSVGARLLKAPRVQNRN